MAISSIRVWQRFVLACALVACCAPAFAAQPNIVLIMVDDMAYHELGLTGQLDRAANGQNAIETPNLDALAQQGLVMEEFYATPICGSSRGALMTGMHNGHSSVDRNGGNNGGNPLREADFTIAQNLKAAGYTTGQYGKWGLGGHATNNNPGNINTATITHPQATPAAKGFDEFYGYIHQVHAHSYYVDYLWEHDTDNSGDVGGMQTVAVSNTDYSHDLIAEKSLDFVSNHADPSGENPFFLYAPYTIPHGQFNPPNDAIRQGYVAAGYSADQADYAAMMKRLDNTVGDLVDRLKDPNSDGNQSDSVYDDTVILFLSDNGGTAQNSLFEGGGDLRGQKGSVYEGGIKTPFFAHWNGTIAPGQTNSTTIAGLDDLFATVSDLAGADRPLGLDGVSIAGLFTGGEAEKRDAFVFEGNGSAWAIRIGEWKLVNGNELYHLPTDTDESNNVIGANAAIADLLREVALDEGVLSDVGAGSAQTTHIVQYKQWSPAGRSTSWATPSNWAGGDEFNTRGTPANNFDTAPADNWVATVENAGANAAETIVSTDSEVLALEVLGPGGEMRVTIDNGASLTARNGVRIGAGGVIGIKGGTLKTMRDVHVEAGGALAGSGAVANPYDTTGTPFALTADVFNEGVVDIAPAPAGAFLVELIANGGFEEGVQSDSDPDYRFSELDVWTTDGAATLDAAKPDNANAGAYRGLIASRTNGQHNALQNTGHAITLGDELTLGFSHRGFLGWDEGIDEIVATVFYVDETQTRRVLETFAVLPAGNAWGAESFDLAPITDPDAAGRELWLSFETVSGNAVTDNEFASLDGVSLLAPGVAPPAPALLAIAGDYEQAAGGSLLVDLNGSGGQAGVDFDQLGVDGVAKLAGQLEVRFAEGYQPQPGDQFVVLSAGEVQGVFDAIAAPALAGGLGLVAEYSPTAVTLTVDGVLGDYSRDGIVGAADFSVWRGAVGQLGQRLAADGDSSGLVDNGDFSVWSGNYGQQTAPDAQLLSVVVPEPSTLVIVVNLLFYSLQRQPSP